MLPAASLTILEGCKVWGVGGGGGGGGPAVIFKAGGGRRSNFRPTK